MVVGKAVAGLRAVGSWGWIWGSPQGPMLGSLQTITRQTLSLKRCDWTVTKLDATFNHSMGDEEKAALRTEVEGRSGFELQL